MTGNPTPYAEFGIDRTIHSPTFATKGLETMDAIESLAEDMIPRRAVRKKVATE